ncbi:uncharacterized protein LOC128225827 [Mya arenaria]|uniref:uncharacterized protein LOC128225827 n=1 Tax=Mya arenaria TaxID=6604 RepID=UPI0022E20ECE|nr:uncharacterized protein LOC128225827 [Mya arenaria]
MKIKIIFSIWFCGQVILSDRDLLNQPGITPNITSSRYFADWSADKILSDVSQEADLCQCCAAIITTGYISIDLMHKYEVSRVVALGRRDNGGAQFENITLTVNDAETVTLTFKNDTFLVSEFLPYRLIRTVTISGRNTRADAMTICNVKVFGLPYSCVPGNNEDGCPYQCGQCRDGNTTCNNDDGHCPKGCAAGYKGYLCNTGEFTLT